jgi:NAD-dependent DNA ligase
MRDFLEEASLAYYSGCPIISDAEYDVLFAHYKCSNVGYNVTDGVEHYFRMYSLQKCFDLDNAPFSLQEAVISPKLDGAAVSLLYVAGKFKLGLTRGDGIIGKDITKKLALLVPESIPITGVIQITGEVVCPKTIENARNVAAGSLNLKDLEEFKTRPVSFVAYDLQGMSFSYWTEAMDFLSSLTFRTVLDTSLRDFFPLDGEVYRINSNTEFESLGYTGHHPRGSFALKEQAAGVVTRLLDVTWQVGKSGVVSPVAILEPVMIGDASVSRATLHNIQYIDALNLELGCQVEVIRSGEIIPRIIRRV